MVRFAYNPALERQQRRPAARVNIAELKQRVAETRSPLLGPGLQEAGREE